MRASSLFISHTSLLALSPRSQPYRESRSMSFSSSKGGWSRDGSGMFSELADAGAAPFFSFITGRAALREGWATATVVRLPRERLVVGRGPAEGRGREAGATMKKNEKWEQSAAASPLHSLFFVE